MIDHERGELLRGDATVLGSHDAVDEAHGERHPVGVVDDTV